MLFKRDQMPGVRRPASVSVATIGGEIVEATKVDAPKRYGPMKDGRCALVRVELARKPSGEFDIRSSDRSAFINAKMTVVSGIHSGRWIYVRMMMRGHKPSVSETQALLQGMLACHDIDDVRVSAVEGLIVPVRITVYERWPDGKTVNGCTALSPDPDHWLYADYVKLCSKLGTSVPGYRLYPMGKALQAVSRWIDDHETEVAGMTASGEQLSKLRKSRAKAAISVERAIDRMARKVR